MSKEAYVSTRPDCDLCKQQGSQRPAFYDGKTVYGPWAYMCEEHMEEVGNGLGTGRGQRLIVGEKPTMTAAEKSAAMREAIANNDMEAVEDIVGDGDLAEWL